MLKSDNNIFGVKIKRNKSSINLKSPIKKMNLMEPYHDDESFNSEDVISSEEDNPVNGFMRNYV